MPRLRILAGSSLSDLKPIHANTGEPTHVSNDAFEGDVALYIKNFADQNGHVEDSSYFKERADVTWSIQVQGARIYTSLWCRGLMYEGQDVSCRNTLRTTSCSVTSSTDRWRFHGDSVPSLPLCSMSPSTVFQRLTCLIARDRRYMDPTLEQDLQSKAKPWALSPLISTMTYFAHTHTAELHKVSPFPPLKPIQDDTKDLRLGDGAQPEYLPEENSPEGRRAYFRDAEHRKAVTFGPNVGHLSSNRGAGSQFIIWQDVITTDFCYDYLSFSPTGVTLQLPAGMTFDMMRYWDGQPVYFVCCERAPADKTKTGQPLGKIFWCVAIEVLEDEQDESKKQEKGETEPQANSDDID